MRDERLDEESIQLALYGLDSDVFTPAFDDPFLGRFPIGIEEEEIAFASSFDELIGLGNQFCSEQPWNRRVKSV